VGCTYSSSAILAVQGAERENHCSGSTGVYSRKESGGGAHSRSMYSRHQEWANRQRAIDSRGQAAGSRKHTAGRQQQKVTRNSCEMANIMQHTAGSRQQEAGKRERVTGSQQQASAKGR
jgi:hypothetical protein